MRNCDIDLRLEDVLPLLPKSLQAKLLHSVDLVRKAERLALAYDPENGYFNTFSGGKDSQALYHVVKLSGVKARTHMSLTSVDPPEVLRFVRRHYPDVELIKPRCSIFQLAVEKRLLPTMRVRWCCEEFKEQTGAGRVTLIGIRHEESPRRARRNEVEISSRKFSGTLEGLEQWREERDADLQKPRRGRKPKAASVSIVNAKGERTLGCIGGKETLLVSPIIDWTEQDVWTFLRAVGAEHCELYDQGFARIGCLGCPMSSPRQKQVENKRWPHVKRNWIQAIKAIRGGGGYCSARIHGYELGRSSFLKGYDWWNVPTGGFQSGSSAVRKAEELEQEIAENIYDWWISGIGYKQWYARRFLQRRIDFGPETDE